MRITAKRKIMIGAALATTALSGTAYAQYAPPVDVPPVHSTTDEFNVDLVTRNIAAQVWGSISIGPSGPGGLNVIISNSNRVGSALNSGLDVNGTTYSVYIADSTTTFTLNGTLGTGTFTNNQANGATLSYNSSTSQYTFVSSNGTVFVLGISGIPWPVSLTYPAGEKLTWNYDASTSPPTLRSVTSNLGYQYRPTYTGTYPYQRITNIVLFNMANESCDPLAVSCTLTNSWPSIDNVAATINGNPMTKWATTTNGDGTSTVSATIPVTSTQNETLTYQVDVNGRVTSVTDGSGVWTYSYATGAPVTQVNTGTGSSSDPVRNIRTVVWDSTTGLIQQDVRIPGGNATADITQFTYDTYQRPQTVTHNGVKSTYTYDGNGNVTQTVTTDTNNANPITTSAIFPSSGCNAKTCNQPTSTTDANNNVTNYTYDPNSGGVATITYPAVTVPNVGSVHPAVTYNYATYTETWKNGSGGTVTGSPVYRPQTISRCMTQATCSTSSNPNDQVLTTIAYDTGNGLQANSIQTGSNNSASSVLQATTAYTYTPEGDLQSVDGPLSGTADTTWSAYDLDRRVIGTIGPLPGNGQNMRAVKVSYTAGGELDTTSIGTATAQSTAALNTMNVLRKSQAQYNAQGLKTQDMLYDNTGAIAGISQYSYTPEGMLQCTAVRNNSSTWTSQSNACAQTSTNTDLITKTTFDDVGNLLTVRDGYTSDSQVPDLTNTWADASMLASQIDGNGNTTTYTYDPFNRLWQTKYPDIATVPTDYEQLTYDNNGNVYSRQTRSGAVINYRYDALNRLTLKSSSVLPDTSYGFDLLGQLLTATFTTSGLGVTNTFDQLGRLTSTSSNVDGTARQFSYGYDLAGRRNKMTYPDGYYLNYDYLTTGEVQTIRANGATTGLNVLATYAYDALGNRSSLTLGNGVVTGYGLDSLYRLHTLTHDLAGTAYDFTRTLAYNPASQLTSAASSNSSYSWTGAVNVNRGYTPNSLNQYASVAGTTFSYDANGNLTSDGNNSFAYDAENKLTSATVGGSAATLSYDPAGRLWHVIKGSNDTRFSYDGPNMAAQYDSSGNLQYRYVFGPGDDEPLLQYNPSGVRTWYTADERGSIISDSDDAGTVSTVNTYDEYGIPGSSNSGRFQYTGQMWLSEIGMYYYKARMYSPTLGRFMQTDPIGYGDGMNWYAYTHNDPVNGTDPSGLDGTTTTPDPGPPIVVHGNGNPNQVCSGDGCWIVADGGPPPTPGGPGPGYIPPDAMNPKVPSARPNKACNNKSAVKFAHDHMADAAKVAAELGVPTENILGLSAKESGWGSGPFTGEDSYFNMEWIGSRRNPGPPSRAAYPPYASRWQRATGNPYVYVWGYPSYLAAAQSFASQWGAAVKGIQDPEAFLQALRKAGFNTDDPTFTDPSTIKMARERMRC